MANLGKTLLYIGLAVLLIALPRTALSQPIPADFGLEQMEMARMEQAEDKGVQGPGAPSTGVPVGMLMSEQGAVLMDNRSHDLRIIIERLMPMEPRHVQGLLASNRSLEEIRDAMADVKGEAIYRGNMKLDDEIYPLIDIRVIPYAENASILEAEVAKPIHDPALINEISIIGHIKMTIEPLKDSSGTSARGELQMNSGLLGKYAFLTDKAVPLREGERDYEDVQMQKGMHVQNGPKFPEATLSQGELN